MYSVVLYRMSLRRSHRRVQKRKLFDIEDYEYGHTKTQKVIGILVDIFQDNIGDLDWQCNIVPLGVVAGLKLHELQIQL